MPNGQTRCQDNYWLQGQESLSSGTGKSFPRSCKYGRRTHYRDSPVDCFIDIPRVFPVIMSLGRHIAVTAGQVEKLLLTPSIEILASVRLSCPSREFDMAHISRCLIPYGDHLYLIEDVRILHPGGYYWISTGLLIVSWERQWKGWEKTEEDLQAEQLEIEVMEKGVCWKELEQKDNLALVIWQKPANHVHRDQNPVMACFTIMENCLAPLMQNERGLNEVADGKLVKWPGKLTLVPPIHECGLMGTYQNWCELAGSSTHPIAYELIHAGSLISLFEDKITKMEKCLIPLPNKCNKSLAREGDMQEDSQMLSE